MAGSIVSGPVDLVFPHMEWGSFPSGWLLFESHRSSIPRPWMSGTLLLSNVKFYFAPEDLAILAGNPYAKSAQMHSKPCIFMSEVRLKDCTLSTGWVFLESSSPDLDSLNQGYSVEKIRVMHFQEEKLARVLMTHEMSEDYIFFTCLRETDARTNVVWSGIIHRMSRHCNILSVSVDIKSCSECPKAGKICQCRNEDVLASCEYEFRRRRQLDEVSHDFAHFGNKYVTSWNQGTWTCHVNMPVPLKPHKLEVKYIFEGRVFDSALTSVVQNEVLNTHPPRASARFLATMQEDESLLGYKYWLASLAALSDPEDKANSELQVGRKRQSKKRSISSGSLGSAVIEDCEKSEIPPKESDEEELSSPGRKFHNCDSCPMQFRRKYDLRRHHRTVHEKRRDFKCEQCSKRFSQQGHVNEHVRLVHEGSRKYSCEFCGKGFGLKFTRDRHLRSVHENLRLYACDICDKSYKDKASLKHHMSTHITSPKD